MGEWPVKPSLPFIPGHEVAGIVAALGPGVTDFKEGDAVGVAWLHDACMRCEYCETGWETLCEQQHNTGYSVNGGFAEFCIADARFVARLPANVDFAAIAPILSLVTMLAALVTVLSNFTTLVPGSTLLVTILMILVPVVFGCGWFGSWQASRSAEVGSPAVLGAEG